MTCVLRNFYDFADRAAFERDPAGVLHRAAGAPPGGAQIAGLFAETDGTAAAIARISAAIVLQIGPRTWAVADPELTLSYQHEPGTTSFVVFHHGNQEFGITYPSWWTHEPEAMDPVAGAPADEDRDFWAYVFAVWRSERVQQSLLARWADAGAA